MKKTRVLAVILAGVLLLTSCGKKEETKEEEVLKPVVVDTVLRDNQSTAMEFSGNVKPGQMVKVAFKVPGTLESVTVKEGDRVSKGQTLMTLNTHDYEIARTAAQAQYDAIDAEIDTKIASARKEAESNLEFINTQLERVKRLHEQGAVATKTVEELELKKDVVETKLKEIADTERGAQERLKQASAMVDLADSKIEDTVLTSPIDGTVIKKLSEEGETVIPGYPTLAIGRLDNLEVEIGVPDKFIDSIIVGSTVDVYVKGLDLKVEGRISKIDAVADLETRTFGVIIDIKNPENKIKPGMIANVNIPMGDVDAITIPINSIIDNAEGSFVFVYDDKNKMVNRRKIEVGEVFGDLIEVTSGLEEGDTLVIEGQYRLNDGEEVKARREDND